MPTIWSGGVFTPQWEVNFPAFTTGSNTCLGSISNPIENKRGANGFGRINRTVRLLAFSTLISFPSIVRMSLASAGIVLL